MTNCKICGAWFNTPDDAECCVGWREWKFQQILLKQKEQEEYEAYLIGREEERIETIAKAKVSMICPHCGGKVKDTDKSWCSYDKDCTRCGRGWRIDEAGTWHALFDAGNAEYSAKDVLKTQKLYR